MRRPAASRAAACALMLTAALGLAACTSTPAPPATGSPSATGTADPGGTQDPTTAAPLVVETVFDHSSLDPTTQFGRSGALLTKALYETLTTFADDDQTTPVSGLAEFTMSPEGNWLTLRLRKGATFSDGSPVTTDDVIFTLDRARGFNGTAARLIGAVTSTRIDDRTVTLTSPGANFALPAILANPAFGILDADAVRAHGGTTGTGDTAGGWLTSHSAGSGPYMLADPQSATPGRTVRLVANPHYRGSAPSFPAVELRDRTMAQQAGDISSGAADVVLDLSPAQAGSLAEASGTATAPPGVTVSLTSMRSSTTAFLLVNQDKRVNTWTANPDFLEAVRLGIDREALGAAAGDALPAVGLIPTGIVGALEPASAALAPDPSETKPPGATPTPAPTGTEAMPTPAPPTSAPRASTTPTPSTSPSTRPLAVRPTRDLAAAKAALARSGYRGQSVPLSYAVDLPIQGIPSTALASTVKAQLADVGITVRLNPARSSEALATYRRGADALGLWSWNPDYPDPENYLAFAPGQVVGLRAGWRVGTAPLVEAFTQLARGSVGADRAAAYTRWQLTMNVASPFVPLVQPQSHFAHGSRVTVLATNPVWTLTLADLR
ncbi:MAG: ABC transporter substrate-binding protein [Terracoccus sp.]